MCACVYFRLVWVVTWWSCRCSTKEAFWWPVSTWLWESSHPSSCTPFGWASVSQVRCTYSYIPVYVACGRAVANSMLVLCFTCRSEFVLLWADEGFWSWGQALGAAGQKAWVSSKWSVHATFYYSDLYLRVLCCTTTHSKCICIMPEQILPLKSSSSESWTRSITPKMPHTNQWNSFCQCKEVQFNSASQFSYIIKSESARFFVLKVLRNKYK